ncbi:MAG: hypothetical protein CMC93_06795, partial [Flavobacteriaceae bacterium]|nr:hypothetical protein [Flavobacteriaceae bacterium]
MTIKDFKKFSNTKLFLDQGLNVIDGNLALNGDDYLMFLKDETQYPPEKTSELPAVKILQMDMLQSQNPSRVIIEQKGLLCLKMEITGGCILINIIA